VGGGGTALGARGDGWALADPRRADARRPRSFTVAGGDGGPVHLRGPSAQRHDPGVLRLRLPSLEALDRLAARATLAGLILLSAGIVVASAGSDVNGLDAAMTVAVLIWVVYALALVVRWEAGRPGRRFARLSWPASLLVVVVLP
jgi:ABC-type transport system involved in cytochrome c biogenesis permease subunit